MSNREKGPDLFNSSPSMNQTAKIAEPVNSLDPQLASDFCGYSSALHPAKFNGKCKAGK